jgi:hypothetical protein
MRTLKIGNAGRSPTPFSNGSSAVMEIGAIALDMFLAALAGALQE